MSAVKQLIGANGRTSTVAALYKVPNGAGSGSTPVSVTISNLVDSFGSGQLDPTGAYSVQVTPNQACLVSVTNKTASGFSVVLTPVGGAPIAAGTFDCWIST
jgi:hypothetical protein